MTSGYAHQQDFQIAGDGCRLTVRLHHYETPSLTSGEDADWVSGEVEIDAGTQGRFTAKRSVSVFTPDLVAFLEQLEALLESLTGQAMLDSLEGEFGCVVKLDHGRGTLSAYVREHVGANLSLNEAKTDQSYVQATVTELRNAIAVFPPRSR